MSASTPPRSTFPPPPSQRPPAGHPVAFLGAGNMGVPMASSVLKKGFPLHVWNRTHEKTSALLDIGAKQKSSPKDCVVGAKVVITMLSDENALFDVLCRNEGVLDGLEPDAVVVDMSTVGRAAALKASEFVKQRNGRVIDAPVSGSIGPALTGDLVALVGGKLNDIAKAQPVILAMCKRILHAGEVGQGQALKVILNGIGAHHLAAFVSMLALGERAGIARRILVDAFTSGAFASPSYIGKKEKVLSKDYQPEFALALALKDSKLNIELQQEVGLPLPVQREIHRALEKAVDEGLGEEDLFALEKYYKGL